MPLSVPRRVLMTADAVGGIWSYALDLAASLGQLGTDVLLAVSGPAPDAAQWREAKTVPGLTVVHRSDRLEWMPGAEVDLARTDTWLVWLAAEFEPDVLHVNGYAAACKRWPCPVVVVCHSCVRSWWRGVHGEDAPREWAHYGARVARALAAADVVVAPTRSFLAEIERLYGRQPRSMVIHNGFGGPLLPGRVKQPVVFSCGRVWDRAKGMDLLDGAAARWPWPTFLAGNPRGADGALAAPPRYVRGLGQLGRDEVAMWLAMAAIFVLPARYEPFGLAALEAAASGCALVLSDVASLRELWDGAALFAEAGSQDALARAVLCLIEDPLLRHELGARALLRARDYGCQPMINGYLAAYRRAAVRHEALATPPAENALPCPPLAVAR